MLKILTEIDRVPVTQPYAKEKSKFAVSTQRLPGLAQAVDDESIREILSSHLAGYLGNNEINQLELCVVKYTPGKRCVIEYWLGLNKDCKTVKRVFGKLYRKNRGEKVFANLQALWNAANHDDRRETFFGMAQPLAYAPKLGMVIQEAVPGRALSSFAVHDDLGRAIQSVARNLAMLHGLIIPFAEKKVVWDHIRRLCHPGPSALGEAWPELAPLVENILKGLAGNEFQAAPLCPVHGDLGLAQIFIDRDQASFIDFDGFCHSHAALDIGNFLVALSVHFGQQSAALTNLFLQTYLERQTTEKLVGLRIYQALAYLRRAMICFRSRNALDCRQQVRRLLETSYAMLTEDSFEKRFDGQGAFV